MIEKLRELLKSATPGAWESHIQRNYLIFAEVNDDPMEVCSTLLSPNPSADTELIVTLRNCAEELLALVEAAKKMESFPIIVGNHWVDMHNAIRRLEKKIGELE